MAFVLLLLALLIPSAAGAAGLRDGQAFRDCRDCPQMVVVPAGEFLMGSPADEAGRDTIEGPQRRVRVGRIAFGTYDVTRGEWAAFVAATHRPVVGGCAWASATGHRPDPQASWRNLNFPQDDRHPVVCVTWGDAQDYARWVSGRTGRTYRLPTEAEWEYAARAGTATAFPWGEAGSHEQANYGAEACCSGLAVGRDAWAQTSPVGAFPPNAFGLHDMQGNVMQWVQDCFSDYAQGKADPSAAQADTPLGPGSPLGSATVGTSACAYRMLRGGDWGDPPRMLRSAYRNYAPPKGSTIADYKSGGGGFRVVREVK